MPSRSLRGARVALVSMPWAAITEPCLGIAILKSVLRRAGIECDVIEAQGQLLRRVKYDTYDALSHQWAVNDFLFTHEFEPEVSPEQLDHLQRICSDDQGLVKNYYRKLRSPNFELETALRMRQEVVPAYLDDLMTDFDFGRYDMVGFTCLFDQTWASLAMARRLKRAHKNLPIAFGGYALEKPVGPDLQACMPEMDVVAYGDGEPIIVPLVEALCGLRPLADVPNISYRDQSGKVVFSDKKAKFSLADSPPPDFDDWFRMREEMRDTYSVTIPLGEMPIESSRGCWWGQKHHCTFCGIDDLTLQYRQKPADVVEKELDALHDRYGAKTFRFNDYIMPMSHFKDFFGTMISRDSPYNLHYETKANLTREQIAAAAAAGVFYLQPGIESFSTPVLSRMRKGVKAIQNIFCIYQMMRHGVHSYYNIIFGFPGDEIGDYEPMLRVIPSLYHLIPPGGVTWPMVTRYAPLETDPRRFGAEPPLKAHWRYGVMFSERFTGSGGPPAEAYAYYFDAPHPYRDFDGRMQAIFLALQHQVLYWEAVHARARLTFEVVDGGMEIRDTRYSEAGTTTSFGPIHAAVCQRSLERVWNGPKFIAEICASGVAEERVRAAVADLIDARVIVEEENLLTGVAFEAGYHEAKKDWWRHQDLQERLLNGCWTPDGSIPEWESTTDAPAAVAATPELVPLGAG